MSKTFRKQNMKSIQKKSQKMIKYENLSKCGLVQKRITGIWTTLESQDFLSQGHFLRLFYKRKKTFKSQRHVPLWSLKTFHNILEKSSTYDPTKPPTPYCPKQGKCSEGVNGIPKQAKKIWQEFLQQIMSFLPVEVWVGGCATTSKQKISSTKS